MSDYYSCLFCETVGMVELNVSIMKEVDRAKELYRKFINGTNGLFERVDPIDIFRRKKSSAEYPVRMLLEEPYRDKILVSIFKQPVVVDPAEKELPDFNQVIPNIYELVISDTYREEASANGFRARVFLPVQYIRYFLLDIMLDQQFSFNRNNDKVNKTYEKRKKLSEDQLASLTPFVYLATIHNKSLLQFDLISAHWRVPFLDFNELDPAANYKLAELDQFWRAYYEWRRSIHPVAKLKTVMHIVHGPEQLYGIIPRQIRGQINYKAFCRKLYGHRLFASWPDVPGHYALLILRTGDAGVGEKKKPMVRAFFKLMKTNSIAFVKYEDLDSIKGIREFVKVISFTLKHPKS